MDPLTRIKKFLWRVYLKLKLSVQSIRRKKPLELFKFDVLKLNIYTYIFICKLFISLFDFGQVIIDKPSYFFLSSGDVHVLFPWLSVVGRGTKHPEEAGKG